MTQARSPSAVDSAGLKGPLRIVSPHAPPEARSRLQACLQKVPWFPIGGTAGLAGSIRDADVRLYYFSPRLRNSFQPILRGTIRAEGQGSVLEGRFRLHPFVIVFLGIWFGLLALQLPAALHDAVAPGLSSARLLVVAGLLMFGVVLVLLGMVLGYRDRARIVNAVCEALDGTLDRDPAEAHPTPTDT